MMIRQTVRANVYYWNGAPNFGDSMAVMLLDKFSAIQAVRTPVSHARIVVTGSVLEHIPPEWDGIVIGAGRLFENQHTHLHTGQAKILAIRGPLSARGIKGDFALGDPGLLADEMVRVTTKKYRLGILPHLSDGKLALDPRFKQFHPKIIDPGGDPATVIRHIGECEKLVTSSLHGMIVADSFGVPRRVEHTPALDAQGGAFKFRDYSQSIRMPFKLGVTQQANKFHVEDRKDELWDAFKELAAIVRRK